MPHTTHMSSSTMPQTHDNSPQKLTTHTLVAPKLPSKLHMANSQTRCRSTPNQVTHSPGALRQPNLGTCHMGRRHPVGRTPIGCSERGTTVPVSPVLATSKLVQLLR